MADFTHIANPVRVSASPICNIDYAYEIGSLSVITQDGTQHTLHAGMLSRYKPVVGDYVVVQEDGYTYVNPKEVFERKYSPIGEQNAS